MRDKIYAYLKSQKRGATSHELVEQVLKIKGASPGISETLIKTAIDGDRRFATDGHHLWKIIERGGTPLSEAELVLLSILTIDTVEMAQTLVEISAQKLRGDKIIDRLHIFVNPGSSAVSTMRLPADLAQEMKGGIPLEKAVCSLFDFLGEAVVVGYDIQSTRDQINKILHTLNKTIENSTLCLKYLAKKLISNLQPKSLDDVAVFFKLPIMDTQRTEEEISTIANIFSLCKELLKTKGFSTLEEVLEFQYPDIEYIDFSKYTFDKSFLWAIPQKPGVYKMKDKHGEIIYVGKAKNLRTRVSSYFWNTPDRLQKTTDLLNNIYTIEYEIVGSELSAMLLEYRLIKQYQPKLNQQFEVHERAARYGKLKNFIAILPSPAKESLELFFVKVGLPLERYEILKGAVNFSGVEEILDKMYYGTTEATSRSFLCTKGNGNSPQSQFDKGRPKGNNAPSGDDVLRQNILTGVETGEMDIVLSWLETNRDQVNYINIDSISTKETCLKLVKDYIRDEETPQKKHFRLK
ncbi:MAG: GIY-YIG nuclease family protein [Candidatus Brocadia sp.]|nr:GIY-YIG nuclease family protein [Candidatus Brocadia sp.]